MNDLLDGDDRDAGWYDESYERVRRHVPGAGAGAVILPARTPGAHRHPRPLRPGAAVSGDGAPSCRVRRMRAAVPLSCQYRPVTSSSSTMPSSVSVAQT